MKLYNKMQQYLADQQVMYIKLHNLHWYVKGASFFTLHEKFEEMYDETAQIIDEVAERLLALGQSPVASMKQALKTTQVKELSDEKISGKDAVNKLIVDIEYWVKDTNKIAKLADEAGDAVTADMFNEYAANYQKTLWMLKSYID